MGPSDTRRSVGKGHGDYDLNSIVILVDHVDQMEN